MHWPVSAAQFTRCVSLCVLPVESRTRCGTGARLAPAHPLARMLSASGDVCWLAVNRLVCVGETYGVNLTIDVNCEVYPVAAGDKLKMALASTLRLDGKIAEVGFDQSGQVGRGPHVCWCNRP